MRETALRHDIYATFMSRPMEREPGSSMHVHQSIVEAETGLNIFATPDGKYTQAFYHYLGGLQQYLPYVIQSSRTQCQQLQAFRAGYFAPINLHWGLDNRTVGFVCRTADPRHPG